MNFHTYCNRKFGSLTDFRFLNQMLRVMKLTAFILIFFGLHVSATTSSQSITLSATNITLEEVFAAIKQQTGYITLFSEDVNKVAKPVTVHVVNKSLESFLLEVFEDQPLQFTINNTSIVVNKKKEGLSESIVLPLQIEDSLPSIKIIGTVMDVEGQLLVGATIRIKGKKTATTSNNKGAFEINAGIGNTLIVSYAGYITAEEKVGSSRSMIVKLEPNALLEEAVIYNGFQKIKQKYLTGSVSSLSMDSIYQPGIGTVDKMLEGRVPGLMVMQNSGQAGAAAQLRLRGTNTFLGAREPLWVVDGVIRTNPIPISAERINDPDFVNLLGNAISGLNPYDIDQIDVLKDATAAALYGVRAANGVIVITTKRGKIGPPSLNYNVTGTYTRRPRYTDQSVFMMNSKERVDVSREMIERQLRMRGTLELYEESMLQYYNGQIDYDTFKGKVDWAETVNTDWLGNVMNDVFATNHTLSISGGSPTTSYRASLGYKAQPGVIKREKSDLYSGMFNMQMNYRKLKMDFNIQMSKENRHYTPSEIGVLNYAHSTSRSIPLYNTDGSLYYYSTITSNPGDLAFRDFRAMNILNEMNNTGDIIGSNQYNASLDISYEIFKGLQFRSMISYTGGHSSQETWFTENTDWAFQLRSRAYNSTTGLFNVATDDMPFGGEYRKNDVDRSNYMISSRIHYSKFLDKLNKHQLSADLATDILSNRSTSFRTINRGYYPDRGHSFVMATPTTYTAAGRWTQFYGQPVLTEEKNHSLRPYITTTYIYDDKYVLSASASQEFSNSFGARSNEKFFPTWAISGRWNMVDDLFKKSLWVDDAALLFSVGTRGSMLPGQTIYTVMQKGGMSTLFNEFMSNIVSFPNPDLAWEKTQDISTSMQFSLFNGRMRGSLGYFFSRTTNAFMNMKVSAVYGTPNYTYVVNGGTLENQGVEVAMNFKLIENVRAGNKKGFMWRFDPQLGQVFNKLLSRTLSSRNVLVDAAVLTYNDYLNGSVPVNGKSVNTFYSYRFKGLDHELGYPIFHGAEVTDKIALFDKYGKMSKEEVYNSVMVESGRREPVIQGGINNSFVYGNWSMNVTFTYSLGNKIRLLNIASGNYGTYRPSSQQNLRKEFVNRWLYPGDEMHTNIPAVQGAVNSSDFDLYAWWKNAATQLPVFADHYYQMYDYSDLRVVKGDYIKLQYISLSYRMPERICKKLRSKGMVGTITGSNLYTFANKALRGQDPTQSGSSPNINLSLRPVYAFNLNVSF